MPEHDESFQPEFSDSAADALFGAAPARVPEGVLTLEELAASFPQHEIVRVLGRGGMGMVYLARHRRHDRLEALKILPPRYGSDAEFAARFEREARALARLNHPNIVAVYDAGQTAEGRLYFTMEYVEGKNLAELIREGAPLNALALGEQMCAALTYAHGEGIVHRDIKPANVLVDALGRVKVADFGLARMVGVGVGGTELTSTGVAMGTMGYMAPEQMRGEAVDHRADLFALGAIFYEMLCRDRPVGVFDPPSRRIGCDPRWDTIVSRAMQPASARRYADATEMRAALAALEAAPPSTRPARRSLAALMWLAALVVGGIFAWKKWEARPQPQAYPEPAQWVDATAAVRSPLLREGAAAVRGDWLDITAERTVYFAGEKQFGDVALRVTYKGTLGLMLRRTPPLHYLVIVKDTRSVVMHLWDTDKVGPIRYGKLQVPLESGYDLAQEHEVVFAARGNRLTLWIDGKRMLEQDDAELARGTMAIQFYGFHGHPKSIWPRIKKVEYAILDE